MAHHDGLHWSPRSLRRALLVGSAIGIIVLAACAPCARRHAQSASQLGVRPATSR